MGQLEFRITADPTQPNSQEREIIRLASELSPAQKEVTLGGRIVAEWVAYSLDEFGPADQEDGRNIVKRLAGDTPEALVLVDPEAVSVTGDYLRSRSRRASTSAAARPSISPSTPKAPGGSSSSPARTCPTRPPARAAISASCSTSGCSRRPASKRTIYSSGQISGRNMREEEVDYVVSILQEGKLPLELDKEPISEQIISPTLGADDDRSRQAGDPGFARRRSSSSCWSTTASPASSPAWRSASTCCLVVAVMVLIKAAFTLPGLAGLVLTIGMSVDANVLIFERMREELEGGAALRMVIRNGFDRAMSAIVDSNVTTIISGIALYLFATDQVKGFAVTLILGILTSMYTAIFVSRLIFDICERQGWIKKLTMLKLLATPNFDFLGVRWIGDRRLAGR